MLYDKFIKTAILFSKIAEPFAFLSMCKISRGSTSSPTADNASFFKFSHSNRCVASIVALICISLMTNDIEHLFMCLHFWS